MPILPYTKICNFNKISLYTGSHMKTKKKLSLLLSICILSACSTQYKAQGLTGNGYTEFRTSPDKFVVSFKSNKYTTPDKTMQFALLRAAELTIAHGYQYFVIEQKEDVSIVKNLTKEIVKVEEKKEDPKLAKLEKNEEVKPGVRLYIKCHKVMPKDADVIDAGQYISFNKAR